MTLLNVAPIVEGHGEVAAVRTLLTRVMAEFAPGTGINVLKPIRVSKSKIVADTSELLRAIDLAALKLETYPSGLVLLIIDSDEDPVCELVKLLLAAVLLERSHIRFSLVVAAVEYETWLIAGAQTLGEVLKPGFEQDIPLDPEGLGYGKGWVEKHIDAPKYSETVDQARLTAAFDVSSARTRSKSFDKLCRVILAGAVGDRISGSSSAGD